MPSVTDPRTGLMGTGEFFGPNSCNFSAKKHEIISKGKRQETVIPFWSASGGLEVGGLSSAVNGEFCSASGFGWGF